MTMNRRDITRTLGAALGAIVLIPALNAPRAGAALQPEPLIALSAQGAVVKTPGVVTPGEAETIVTAEPSLVPMYMLGRSGMVKVGQVW